MLCGELNSVRGAAQPSLTSTRGNRLGFGRRGFKLRQSGWRWGRRVSVEGREVTSR